jgi:hypothetical protein
MKNIYHLNYCSLNSIPHHKHNTQLSIVSNLYGHIPSILLNSQHTMNLNCKLMLGIHLSIHHCTRNRKNYHSWCSWKICRSMNHKHYHTRMCCPLPLYHWGIRLSMLQTHCSTRYYKRCSWWMYLHMYRMYHHITHKSHLPQTCECCHNYSHISHQPNKSHYYTISMMYYHHLSSQHSQRPSMANNIPAHQKFIYSNHRSMYKLMNMCNSDITHTHYHMIYIQLQSSTNDMDQYMFHILKN